jgi:hypothetical protein
LDEDLKAQPADQVRQANLVLQVLQVTPVAEVFQANAVVLVRTEPPVMTVHQVRTTGVELAPRDQQAVTTSSPSAPTISRHQLTLVDTAVIGAVLAILVKQVPPVSLVAMERTVQPAEQVVQVDKVLQALLADEAVTVTQDERVKPLEAWDQWVNQVLTVFQVEVASKVLKVLEATTVLTVEPAEWAPTVSQAAPDEKVLAVRAADQVITDEKVLEVL